jgi:hypothetical protein
MAPPRPRFAVSHFEITREVLARGGAISIGKPHPDSTFHLVDENGRLIDEPDRVGELHIGGARSCPATGRA